MKRMILAVLLSALALGACSVEIQSTSSVATAVPATETAVPPTGTPTAAAPSATPVSEGAESSPEAGPDGETPVVPGPTAAPTTDSSAWNGFTYLDPSLLEFSQRSGWEDFSLAGSLLFLSFTEQGQSVVVFDFASGTFAPLFVSPENTWVLSVSAPPVPDRLLISYAPPPEEGESQFGYSDLYLLMPGAGVPEPLLERPDPLESYFFSSFGNAGESVFFSWFFLDESVNYGFRYHINRLDLASGSVETVVEDAYWETLSAGDDLLAYVVLDPNAGAEDPAALRVRELAGSEDRAVLDPARFPTVDAPFFSPDGRYLYFSAVSEPPGGGLSWLDRLLGVSLASAHNVPSDWWRVDLETAEVERITEVFDQGLFGVFSSDGEWIAFISSTGLWVMRPDGSELTQVISSGAFYGNLEWIE